MVDVGIGTSLRAVRGLLHRIRHLNLVDLPFEVVQIVLER